LNAKVTPDAYPLPPQHEVVHKIRGKEWQSDFDLIKAFYQRYVKKKERWKLAVISDQTQGPGNIQRHPHGIVRFAESHAKIYGQSPEPHKTYAKCYIDNIIVFSDTFEEHIQHVHAVLSTLASLGMTLSPDKCHVAYHSLELLGHKVDRFGLTTLKEKVDAIASLQYPKTLDELEYFLGLTGYYLHFVARYAGIADPIQQLKTHLLKGSARMKRRQRQTHTKTSKVPEPSELELTAFNLLKDALCSDLLLIHHDPNLPLLYYFDSCVVGWLAFAIHQVPQDAMDQYGLTAEDIMNGKYDRKLEKPVMYLSRMLNKHEVHYWPTELEITGIVWGMQKTRHLIEGSAPVKVYTDHKSAEDILSFKSFKTTSSVRQNLRLTRESQFVSQYPNVTIVYRPGKDNVNADALSRLTQLRTRQIPERSDDQEGVYGFNFAVTVVGLMPDDVHYNGFQARIVLGHVLLYIIDPLDPRLCVPQLS